MNTRRMGSVWIVCALLAVPVGLYAQTPMSTAFAYQGRLTDRGSPANGDYDFKFSLYDALTGGSQAGSTLPLAGVPVANGLFTVQLDFGDYFRGDALWLEIEVAPYKGGSYTLLSPRQELTPAPYAMYAQTAGSAVGGISGSGSADRVAKFTATRTLGDSTIFDNGTNVGIGTAAPGQRLSVNGLIESLTGGFKFPDGTIQTTADTGGTCFWQQSGSTIYYNSGNVGIGMADPDNLFVVEKHNDSNIVPMATFRTTSGSSTGAIRFQNGNGNHFNFGITKNDELALGYNANVPLAGDLLRITSAGDVGIGKTSPSAKLHAAQTAAADALRVEDELNDTTPFVIDQDGNVGVGTAGPSAKLDVSGDVQTTGRAAIGTTLHSDVRLNVATDSHAYGMYSQNSKAGGSNTGFRASASGTTTGDNFGIYGECAGSSSNNYGLYGFAGTPGSGNNYGVYGFGANSGTGNAYAGFFSGDVRTTGRAAIGTTLHSDVRLNVATDDHAYGMYSQNSKAGGTNTGIRGSASGTTTGVNYGVYGESSGSSDKNYGVYGFAGTPSSGNNYGVYGYAANSGGGGAYAGYFSGTTILYGNVGISTTSFPTGRRINTDTGAYLSTGGTWTNSSSRDQKENIKPADGRAVLEKLVTVPVSTWNYKAEDAAIRHMGPMAQDLYEAFKLNGNNETISTIDTGGLSFAAIQGLYQIIQEQQKQIEAMKSEIDRLKTQVSNQQ